MTQSRRERLEAMLQASPNDTFLQYGLAMEYLREGARPEGLRRLREIIEQCPDYQAAYFQLGQALIEDDETQEARTVLRRGIDAAHRGGNDHAAGEMETLLMTLAET